MERAQDDGHVQAAGLVVVTADVADALAKVARVDIPVQLQLGPDGRGLPAVPGGGLRVVQPVGQLGAVEKRPALCHARREMRGLLLLPVIEAGIPPVVGEVLQIGLDDGLRRKHGVVEMPPYVCLVARVEQVVGEADERDRPQRRPVVLRPAPGLGERGAVHVELRLPEPRRLAGRGLGEPGELDVLVELGAIEGLLLRIGGAGVQGQHGVHDQRAVPDPAEVVGRVVPARRSDDRAGPRLRRGDVPE